MLEENIKKTNEIKKKLLNEFRRVDMIMDEINSGQYDQKEKKSVTKLYHDKLAARK